MTFQQYFATGIILLFCSTLQSAVGFGFNLAAIPSLLFLGFSLQESIILCIVSSSVQRLMAVTHLWGAVDWRELIPMVVICAVTLPLGIYFMYVLSGCDQAFIRQCIGICIIAILILQWAIRISPREVVHVWWGYLAAVFSGILYGLASIGGPPIIFWVFAHRWSNEKMRVTIQAYSLPITPILVAMMVLAFGTRIFYAAMWGLSVFPFVLIGTWIGLAIGGRITKETLRVLAQILLIIIAVTAIVRPLF